MDDMIGIGLALNQLLPFILLRRVFTPPAPPASQYDPFHFTVFIVLGAPLGRYVASDHATLGLDEYLSIDPEPIFDPTVTHKDPL